MVSSIEPNPNLNLVFALLPGPDRKREERAYYYFLTYRNPVEDGTGCVMLWEVSGGRMAYQIALERDEAGTLRFHCTCADAVFRGETEGHLCKHVRGLLDLRQPTELPECATSAAG
jgi:hypothetical protein